MNKSGIFSKFILIFLLLSLVTPINPVRAYNDSPCECVVYVVHKLFGKPLDNPNGRYDYAYQLAEDYYWSIDHLKKSGIKNPEKYDRYRVLKPTPQYDDVIIFQPNATFWVFDYSKNIFVKNTQIGWSDQAGKYVGHIGIVRRTAVRDKIVDGNKVIKGWSINFENANWPENWSSIGSSYGTVEFKNVVCSNVIRSSVFIPDGSKVSFWRLKK